jgi:hypothetical protein
MDERVETFLTNVMALSGRDPHEIRAGVLRYLSACENQYRAAETDERRMDLAAQMCRTLCRVRVVLEAERSRSELFGDHWPMVLDIIDASKHT